VPNLERMRSPRVEHHRVVRPSDSKANPKDRHRQKRNHNHQIARLPSSELL
jgi:hypothetical protein